MRIDAYLVAMKLDTASVASYLGASRDKDGTLVLGTELTSILKNSRDEKFAVLYPFGAVCLVNLDNIEVRHFLHFLVSMGNVVDEAQFARYADNYVISLAEGLPAETEMSGARVAEDLEGFALCACDVMARSLLYERLDDRADALFDRGEAIAGVASSGRLFYIQYYMRDLARFLRFQADYAYACDVRATVMVDTAKRAFRARLEALYDIRGRTGILGSKSDGLDAITKVLSEQSYRRQELRVYAVQAVLILSFVMLDLVYYFG